MKLKFFFSGLFLMILLISAFRLMAQDGRQYYTVTGKLTDSLSGDALLFANVAVLKISDTTFVRGSTSEEDGSFKIIKIPEGDYILKISYIGYNSPMIPINCSGSNRNIELGVISLVKQSLTLNTVEISETKPIYLFSSDKKIYNVSEDPVIQNGVASDALQNAPGVSVDMEGNISLRGVSGVAIWINNKPSKLSPEGLKSYLQQLPANTLERIEVITNPSARYSASGSGGIINIITRTKIKKNLFLSYGIRGSTRPNYSPWLSFAWSNEKFSLSTYVSYSNSVWNGSGLSNNTIFSEGDSIYSLKSKYDTRSSNQWSYAHLNGSWQINDKNSMDIYAGGHYSWNNYGLSQTTEKFEYQPVFYYNIIKANNSNGKSYNLNSGITYNHDFKEEGHKLSFDLYGGRNQSDAFNFQSENYSTDLIKDKDIRAKGFNRSYNIDLDISYDFPFNDSTGIEAGIEAGTGEVTSSDINDTLDFINNTYLFDQLLSNIYSASNRNLDIFLLFSGKLWGISYKLGLRSEYDFYHINSIATRQNFNRDFFSIYPSVFLSYTTKNQHNISLSYSRRVEYPEYELDPFIDYSNEENISGGNPLLKASYTNALEAGYAKYFKSGGSFSTSIYYRYTGKDITHVTNPVFDTVLNQYTLFSTYENSGKNTYTGMELTYNIRPAKFVNIMINGNLYYSKIKADLGQYLVNKDQFSWDIRVSPNFTIAKNIRIQATGVYRSGNLRLQGSSQAVYFINLFARADFFKRKLSVNIGIQDIFNWQDQKSRTNTPTLTGNSEYKYVTRYISAGITVRLGKIELENKVKTGNEGVN